MTEGQPYQFEELGADGRNELYHRALHQLEEQIFEVQLNLRIVPKNLHHQMNNGESLIGKMDRLQQAVIRLKSDQKLLVG